MKITRRENKFTRILRRSGLTAIILLFFAIHAFPQVQIGEDLIDVDFANPKTYEIGGITISGVKYLDQNVLIMLSGLNVGDEIQIPGDAIPEAIRSLWKQGLFENVVIKVTARQGNAIFLDIELKERPKMTSFTFEGIKKTEADNIRDEIKITRGDVVNENMILRVKDIIRDYYAAKGYLDTEVAIRQITDTTRANTVRLVIDIDKNSKVKIASIDIQGNEAISDERIKGVFKETKEKGVFRPLDDLEILIFNLTTQLIKLDLYGALNVLETWSANHVKLRIFKSSKFIEEEYEADKQLLIDKYNKLGYRDAIIVKDSVYRNPDNTLSIDIWVNEGDRYYFGDIYWVGNTKYTDEQLNRILKIEKGEIYNSELLYTNLNYNPSGNDVSSLYLDDGYLFFTANPVEVGVENDSIDIEIRIREGEQARIGEVKVEGNTRTNDHVIMREIRTRPGELFSRADLIRTTRELAQLKYFNPETITPDVRPDPANNSVDITYVVEETSADQIELSGGWGYGRIIGTLGLSFNNFSIRNILKKGAWRPVPTGDGQKLSVRLQTYGKGYFSYSASFTEPWLGGKKPNNFSVSYYHSLYSNTRYAAEGNTSQFKIDGLSFALGRRLQWPDDYFILSQGINLQRYDLENYGQIFSFGTGTGDFNNINYRLTLTRNSISQYIYPRYGSEVSLLVEATPPYSLFSDKDYSSLDENEKYRWIEYHKWKFKSSWFTELAPKLVLSTRTQFGFLGLYNREIGITPFDRFYLGGDGLSGYNNLDGREIIGMRGYANESVTPQYYVNKNIGGTIYTKYTLELRYPMSLNPNATIYATAFLEAGNSWLDFNDFDPFDVKRSAGAGLRVFLPMFGLLGLDWAYGFDDIPGLPDAGGGQFHFSINQSID